MSQPVERNWIPSNEEKGNDATAGWSPPPGLSVVNALMAMAASAVLLVASAWGILQGCSPIPDVDLTLEVQSVLTSRLPLGSPAMGLLYGNERILSASVIDIKIWNTGSRPILPDVDEDSWNLSLEAGSGEKLSLLKLKNTHPADMEIRAAEDRVPNRLKLHFGLLNPSDFVELRLLAVTPEAIYRPTILVEPKLTGDDAGHALRVRQEILSGLLPEVDRSPLKLSYNDEAISHQTAVDVFVKNDGQAPVLPRDGATRWDLEMTSRDGARLVLLEEPSTEPHDLEIEKTFGRPSPNGITLHLGTFGSGASMKIRLIALYPVGCLGPHPPFATTRVPGLTELRIIPTPKTLQSTLFRPFFLRLLPLGLALSLLGFSGLFFWLRLREPPPHQPVQYRLLAVGLVIAMAFYGGAGSALLAVGLSHLQVFLINRGLGFLL